MPLLNPFSNAHANISWFDGAGKDNFSKYVPTLPHPLLALQIGVFQGDASIWLLDNIPDIHLTDVDSWTGIDTIPNPVAPFTIDFEIAEKVYDSRMAGRANLVKIKSTSDDFFANYGGPPFDFIYIDGDHHAPQALIDLNNAHANLVPGGILAFDDYTHGCFGLQPEEQPYLAFDAFCASHPDDYTLLVLNQQGWLRKRKNAV